jgi:hypothetical protein
LVAQGENLEEEVYAREQGGLDRRDHPKGVIGRKTAGTLRQRQ